MTLVIKYFFWSLVYHLSTFFKQNPLSFFVGLFMLAYHFFRVLSYPFVMQVDAVKNGLESLKKYWQLKDCIPVPRFVEKKFTALEHEVSHQGES